MSQDAHKYAGVPLFSSALEELSVRANMALVQKKVNNELTSGDLMGDGFDEEYHTLCAQVVSLLLHLKLATYRIAIAK